MNFFIDETGCIFQHVVLFCFVFEEIHVTIIVNKLTDLLGEVCIIFFFFLIFWS